MAGVGAGGGRSGNGFCRAIVDDFDMSSAGRARTRGGDLFYGTSVVFGSLKRGTKPRTSAEAERPVKTRDVVPPALVFKP